MKLNFSKNPLIIFTIVTITGILFGKYFLPFEYAIWTSFAFVALFLISIFIVKSTIVSHLFLLSALLFSVAARFSAINVMPINHIAFLDYSKIESIIGKVINTKYKLDNKNKYTISVSKAEINGVELETNGKILLSTQKIKQKYSYGDLLKIRCKLQEPKGQRNPGQFDYKNYLADDDIYLITFINQPDSIDILDRGTGNIFIQAIIEPVKNYINKTIQSFLSHENGSILKALILGEKQDINDGI
jgi:competence protein ComEC